MRTRKHFRSTALRVHDYSYHANYVSLTRRPGILTAKIPLSVLEGYAETWGELIQGKLASNFLPWAPDPWSPVPFFNVTVLLRPTP